MFWNFLRSPNFFPLLSIVLGLCATVRWAWERNALQAAFWGLGVAITVAFTYIWRI